MFYSFLYTMAHFLEHLNVVPNRTRKGEYYVYLPIEYIGEFITYLHRPQENKTHVFYFDDGDGISLDFEWCTIEWNDGEDVFTIKVKEYDYILDEQYA